MAKKITLSFFSFILVSLLVLPSYAAQDLDVPSTSVELYSHGIGFVYQNANTPTGWLVSTGSQTDSKRAIALNIDKSSLYLCFPMYALTTTKQPGYYTDSDAHTFKGDYTYHVQLVLQVNPDVIYPTQQVKLLGTPSFTDSEFREVGGVGFPDVVKSINQVCTNTSYTWTAIGDQTYAMDIVFNCPPEMEKTEYNALTFLTSITGVTNIYMSTQASNAYYDYNQTIYNNLVLGQLDDLNQTIQDGNKVTQEKLDEVRDNLNSLDQSVIQGNQQAHEDNLALQNKLEELQQKEKDEVESAGNTSEGEDGLKEALSLDAFNDSIDYLFTALSYSGTDAYWTFPGSGDIPFVGHLWDSGTIDFNYWLSFIDPKILTVVRFIVVFGALGVIVYQFNSIVLLFGTGGDDD